MQEEAAWLEERPWNAWTLPIEDEDEARSGRVSGGGFFSYIDIPHHYIIIIIISLLSYHATLEFADVYLNGLGRNVCFNLCFIP